MVFFSQRIKLSELWDFDLSKIKGSQLGVFSDYILDEENYTIWIDTIEHINRIKKLKLRREHIEKLVIKRKGKDLKKLLEEDLTKDYPGIEKDRFSIRFNYVGPILGLLLTGHIYELAIFPEKPFSIHSDKERTKDREAITGETREVKRSRWNLPFLKLNLPFTAKTDAVKLNDLFDYDLSKLNKRYNRFGSYSTINDKWVIVEVGYTMVIAAGFTIGFKLRKTISVKFEGNRNEKTNQFNDLITQIFYAAKEFIQDLNEVELKELIFAISLNKLDDRHIQLNLESCDSKTPLEIRIILNTTEQPQPIRP